MIPNFLGSEFLVDYFKTGPSRKSVMLKFGRYPIQSLLFVIAMGEI